MDGGKSKQARQEKQEQKSKQPKESSQEDIVGLVAVSAEVGDKIRRLDSLINKYAEMLDFIQPFAPGKLGVRFMALRGGDPQEPAFIAWKYTRATRQARELKLYDIVPANRVVRQVKRYGPFKGTESDVRFVLRSLREMIERRKALMTVAGRFRQAIHLSLNAVERAHGSHLTSYRAEYSGLVDRHHFRLAEWKREQEEKARAEAELEAMGAIPDPADLLEPFILPPEEDDTPGALPVDEDGNYVGP